MLEKKFITVSQLNQALIEQAKTNLPLGAVLVQMGLVKEDELIQVLGMQLQLKSEEIDPYTIPLGVIQALPRQIAIKFSLFPLELINGKLVVAAANLISREQIEIISQQVGKHLELRLTSRSDLSFAIRTGYERLTSPQQSVLTAHTLADILLEHRIVSAEELKMALKIQRQSYMRLGDILVGQKVLTTETLERVIDEYAKQSSGQLGDFIVHKNLISTGQLHKALAIQTAKFLKLGDILFKMGAVSSFFREVLKMAESQLISVDIFKKLIIMTTDSHPVSEKTLNKLLSLFETGKISTDILSELLDRIECGDIAEENLLKLIVDVEDSIASDTGLIQALAQLETNRTHVAK